MTARDTLLGACLALPLAGYGGSALAGPPAGPQTITVPPGALVLVLPGVAEAPGAKVAALPADGPVLRMIAEQNALMHRMMAEMHAAFTQPTWPFTQPLWPMQMDRTTQAAFGSLPTGASAAGTVFSAMSGGPGVCSERMTYVDLGNGTKPQVTVTRSGDGCGQGVAGARGVMQAVPAQRPAAPPSVVAPAAPAHGLRLWSVSDPPQEILPAGAPQN